MKWELFSKQQNTISFAHAWCWLPVDKYLTWALFLLWFGEWHFLFRFSQMHSSSAPLQNLGKRKAEAGKNRDFRSSQRHNLVWYFVMNETVEKGVNWNLCSVALHSGSSSFFFYPVVIINCTDRCLFFLVILFSISGKLLWCLSLQDWASLAQCESPPSWEIMHWLWHALLNPCWVWVAFWDATQV